MGIPLGSQFDLTAAIPLDSRNVKADLTARDAIPSVARFEGLEVFVVSEQLKYRLEGGITNSHWVVAGGSGGVINDDIINDTILIDNGITYLIIGDTAQNRSIHLQYTLQRGTAYQEGVIKLLYDGTNVFMYDDFQDNGSALGVVFTADINGTEIRLVATATSTGDASTFKATVKRIMI